MEKVSIDDVPPEAPPDDNVPDGAMATSVGGARQLAAALEIEGFALNHYELDPGQSSAHSMHKHPVQEEVILVLDGTVRVETPGESDDVRLDEGEALRVPPDAFQFVVNRSEEPVSMLMLGSPLEYQEQSRYLIDCPDCGERTEQTFGIETDEEGDPETIVCSCEACGGHSHRIDV